MPPVNIPALQRFASNSAKPVATVSGRDIAAILQRIEAGDAAMVALAKLKAAK